MNRSGFVSSGCAMTAEAAELFNGRRARVARQNARRELFCMSSTGIGQIGDHIVTVTCVCKLFAADQSRQREWSLSNGMRSAAQRQSLLPCATASQLPMARLANGRPGDRLHCANMRLTNEAITEAAFVFDDCQHA